jgi:hypothetical protein
LATRYIHTVLLVAMASPALFAQVSFTLSTKDAKTTFRLGEPVEVEFRFQSTVPGAYSVWTRQTVRQIRISEYDHFVIEPSTSVADPLSDIFAQMSGGWNGPLASPVPLTGAPVILGLRVNEWLSFRKPGHYSITAETTRVVTSAPPLTPVPLRSNSIEIDVVAPEPGWAEAQLQQAIAVLQIPDPPMPKIGQSVIPSQLHDVDVERAARTLRYLETREAAEPLARFFEHGPQAAEADLRAGLFGSPYRKEVIAAMEEAVAAPDTPITYYYLATLMELSELARFGGLPLYTAKTPEEIQRWGEEFERPYREKTKPVEAEYFAKLADAIGRKQGQALAVSLETLLTRGPDPAPPATVKALIANFRLLPEFSQQMFLTQQWFRIASPQLEPMIQSLAEGNGAGGNDAVRDSALGRLQELDPDAARKIILDRIQKAGTSPGAFNTSRVLLTLPDEALPQADDALVAALEQNKPFAAPLIARYASDAALPRLRAWVEQRPQRMCDPFLPAYFFRVDAAWASEALARARKLAGVGCSINLASFEYLLMSPALERQTIDDLSSSDLAVLRSAQALLQSVGSVAAEKPLLDAFARFKAGAKADAISLGVEYGFVAALLNANGWLPSEETFNQARAYCVTDQCLQQVSSARKGLEPPLSIDINVMISDVSSINIGTLALRNLKQFQDKIAQFPKGTSFYLTGNGAGSWYYQQRSAEVRKILEDASMKVVDRPPAVH